MSRSAFATVCVGLGLFMARGALVPASVHGASCYPPPRLVVQGTGAAATVYDAATKLTWQQAASSTVMTWDAAKAYCAAPFRLPSMKELLTIVDHTVASPGPTINAAAFPNTPAAFFWTSSAVAGATDAWYINFEDGSSYYINATNPYRVRCVR